ncbi:hypothetical protein DFQ26_005662 [Actinomortierella ambigua]|nr:hypothetical protein DFQ26_005662 [Actinomortierella ambigua]
MNEQTNASNAEAEQKQNANAPQGDSENAKTNNKAAFFADLDDSVANVEQEDSGLLPPAMSTAPIVTVKSLGKKRRFGTSSSGASSTDPPQDGSSEDLGHQSAASPPPELVQQPKPPELQDTVPTEVPEHSSYITDPTADASEPAIVQKRTKVVHFDLSDSSDSSQPTSPVAKDTDHPEPPIITTSSAKPVSVSSSNSKAKITPKTVASRIGSRRKPIPTPTKRDRSPSSNASANSPSASTSTPHRRRKIEPPSSSKSTLMSVPATIIELDSDTDEDHVSGQTTSNDSKPTAIRRFEGVRAYVVPTGIDSMYYELLRDRLLAYGGTWLGPPNKPRPKRVGVVSDRPEPIPVPYQPDITTHVVSSLKTRAAVCAALQVESIDPKVALVDSAWLSDSLELRTPLDSVRFLIPDSLPRPATETGNPPEGPKKSAKFTPKPPDSPPRTNLVTDSDDEQAVAGDMSLDDVIEEVRNGSLELDHLTLDELPSDTDNHDREEAEDDHAGEAGHETAGHEAQELPSSSEADAMIQGTKSKQQEALLNYIAAGKKAGGKKATFRTKAKYRCQEPHTGADEYKYNRRVLEQLEQILHYYERTEQKGSKDKWRVVGYRKAITAIRALDFELTSEEMAARIQGIGPRIAKKIGECISMGRISKLNYLGSEFSAEQLQVDNLFRNIYGVGAAQAELWFKQGLRTLDDVRQLSNLTQNQQVGLKYYEDLLKRIPRKEVEEIGEVVKKVALELHPDIECEVTGSYRRGAADCGDVDMVISRPGVDLGSETFPIMNHILERLEEKGFLTDHLSLPVWSDDMQNQYKHFKYMGICKLPGTDRTHHHIDLLVVPARDRGSTLIYFTGNDVFNRSIRQLAFRRGMHLSDKGLWDRVIRDKKRNIIDRGTWVAGHTEKEVFDYLKVDWLEPHERNC